jgi:hypothetical protein
MKKNYQKKLFLVCNKKQTSGYLLAASLFIFLFCLNFSLVFAETVNPLEELKNVAQGSGLPQETDVPLLIGRIIRIFLSFAGLILVVMIIAGGILWMTSGGEEEKIKKAKGLIQSAVIGLAIVILSYTIAYFVIEALQRVSTGGGSGINAGP